MEAMRISTPQLGEVVGIPRLDMPLITDTSISFVRSILLNRGKRRFQNNESSGVAAAADDQLRCGVGDVAPPRLERCFGRDHARASLVLPRPEGRHRKASEGAARTAAQE